jgi:S-phase kinase-associated protein 1
MGKVKVVTQDGDQIEVDIEIAQKCVLIKNLMDDAGNDDEEIPLTNVKTGIFNKVTEFCEYIKDNPAPEIEKPLRSSNLADVVPQWFAQFVEMEQEVLFELILAANYLDVKPLLELSCAKVASMIKGKSIPEIRKFFNIENDFTPEEEAQVMEENKWAEEAF